MGRMSMSETGEGFVACSVGGCDRPTRARGLCATHYRAARRHGLGLVERAALPPCKVEGCGKASLTRGYCKSHYTALIKHGDPLARRQPKVEHPCAVEGCPNLTKRQYCNAHETRLRRHGDVHFKPPTKNGGPCQVEGCSRVAVTGGLCATHYRRLQAHGDTAERRPALSPEQIDIIQRNPERLTNQQLAERFGARSSTIVAVKSGRNWGWLA